MARDVASSLDLHAHVRGSIVPYVLEIVGDRFTPSILYALLAGPGRFDALVGALGIARSTLTSRLRHLEARGCVARRRYSENPPRDEYVLTPKGRALAPVLLAVARWDARWAGVRTQPLPHRGYGHALEAELVCSCCGAPIRARDAVLLEPPEPVEPLLGPVPGRRSRGRGPADLEPGNGPITAGDILGDRWVPMLLALLFYGVRRYSDLEAFLGIAPNILARRLTVLVDQGVLERRLYQTSPERFEYRLTRKGRELFPLVVAMTEWGDRHLRPRPPREVTLVHRPCGAPLRSEVRCSVCERVVAVEELR